MDIEEIRKIINNSGNRLHSKVVNHLHSKGWQTLISPYYTDGISDKPREIDLIAEKAFPVFDSWRQRMATTINVKLFIECKYITSKTVFWFSKLDKKHASELLVNQMGFRENNSYTSEHHYLNSGNEIAKLFASSKSGAENDPIYKALNQSISGMIYSRGSGSILPVANHLDRHIIEYPVILCHQFDDFYRVEMDNDENPANIGENFMLEVNYAYINRSQNHVNEYFLIDVVSLTMLDQYLSTIDSDVEKLSIFISPE